MHSESQTMTNTARQTLMMSLKEIVFTERRVSDSSDTNQLRITDILTGRVCVW